MVMRDESGRDSRFTGGGGKAGLAPEGEGDLLDGGSLCEVEDEVAGEEGGCDVDACALEDEEVGVDLDVEGGESVLLAGHVMGVVGRGAEGGGVGGDALEGVM